MRLAPVLCLALFACGPKVAPKGSLFDEDLPKDKPIAEVTPAAEVRAEAPAGKGLRSGTIERARLVAVLDSGPGMFLRQFEITPNLIGDRFVGWQLVQLLDRTGPLHDVDLVPGDILLAVNGKPLARPDQFQTIWDSLRTANELRAQLWRGKDKLELAFVIEPKLDGTPALPTATPTPTPMPTATPTPTPTPTPTATPTAKQPEPDKKIPKK